MKGDGNNCAIAVDVSSSAKSVLDKNRSTLGNLTRSGMQVTQNGFSKSTYNSLPLAE